MQGWRGFVVSCTFVGLMVFGCSGAVVWAETTDCTAITTVPFTITTQGIYCVTQDIETNLAGGNAIEIDASNVVLDLNGHKLGNLTAGPGTQATGIFVDDRKNVTIKNGMVRGFLTGIFLSNAGHSSGNIIESIRADLNTFLGMEVDGTGNTIRHNLVVATGGTTVPAFGI